jgi:hypothetical protein
MLRAVGEITGLDEPVARRPGFARALPIPAASSSSHRKPPSYAQPLLRAAAAEGSSSSSSSERRRRVHSPGAAPDPAGGAWRLDAAHTAAAPDAHDDRVVGGASASAAELSSSIISAS